MAQMSGSHVPSEPLLSPTEASVVPDKPTHQSVLAHCLSPKPICQDAIAARQIVGKGFPLSVLGK